MDGMSLVMRRLRDDRPLMLALVAGALVLAVGGVVSAGWRSSGTPVAAAPDETMAGPMAVEDGAHGGYAKSAAHAIGLGMPEGGDRASAMAAQDAVADTGAEAAASSGKGRHAETPGAAPLVVWTATVGLRVNDVTKAATALRKAAERVGGHVEQLHLSSDENQPPVPLTDSKVAARAEDPSSGSITIRVPAARFSAFMESARGIGTARSESRSSEDVTAEHVDLKARLDNLKAEEARLRTFFESASKVSEMLAIETELARVQGEIESMTAQLEALEGRAAMATVTMELSEPLPVVRPQGGDWGVAAAVTEGVRRMVGTFNRMIVLAFGLLPIVSVAALVGAFVLWLGRRAGRRAEEAVETT